MHEFVFFNEPEFLENQTDPEITYLHKKYPGFD